MMPGTQHSIKVSHKWQQKSQGWQYYYCLIAYSQAHFGQPISTSGIYSYVCIISNSSLSSDCLFFPLESVWPSSAVLLEWIIQQICLYSWLSMSFIQSPSIIIITGIIHLVYLWNPRFLIQPPPRASLFTSQLRSGFKDSSE